MNREAGTDLRLAGAAVAAWSTCYGLLFGTLRESVVVGAVAAGTAVLASAARRPWSAGLAMIAVAIAAGAVCTALRLPARDDGPLATLTARRADATLWLRITDDPQPVRSALPGHRSVLVRATVSRVRAGGHADAVGGRVLVLADDPQWSTLLPSQHLEASGHLLAPRGGDLTTAVLSARGPPRQIGAPSRLQRVAGHIRAGMRSACAPLPEPERGLLPGLVLGDVSALPTAVVDDFRTTGLTHLVAVSGSNCAIVVGAVLVLLRRCRAGPRFAAAVCALTLIGFVVVARPSPSVLRAAVMGAIGLLALATGRPRVALPTWSAAVLLLVLADPALAGSAGFALSALATLALVLLAPRWSDALAARMPRAIADALAIPAAAQVACAPLIAGLSGQVSIVSVLANLLVVPAVAPATVLGVLAAVISPMWTPGATLLARLATPPTWWMVTVAEHGARLPGATVGWPSGGRGVLTLVALVVVAAIVARVRALRRPALAGLLGVGLVVAPLRLFASGWPPAGWAFVACDVGQGDGLVLRSGPHRAVVVDTGPEPAAIDRCLRRLHVATIDLLVLSHLHVDHAGGITGALRGRSVRAIEVGPTRTPADQWDAVRRAATSAGVPIVAAAIGADRQIGAVRLQVLGPVAPFAGARTEPNTGSLVIRATLRHRTLLLAGDTDTPAERALLAGGPALRADVLKVAHHGSADQDPRFVAAVHPRLAIISVGAGNDYGQPAPGALASLGAVSALVRRTDRDGDVAVTIDAAGRLGVTTSSGRARSP